METILNSAAEIPGAPLAGLTAREGSERATAKISGWRAAFVATFDAHFPRVHRYLNRLSGDPDLASELAQDVFVRLYERGELPDDASAWLFTVATNLFRNAKSKRARRFRLLV